MSVPVSMIGLMDAATYRAKLRRLDQVEARMRAAWAERLALVAELEEAQVDDPNVPGLEPELATRYRVAASTVGEWIRFPPRRGPPWRRPCTGLCSGSTFPPRTRP